jgi:ferredoxin
MHTKADPQGLVHCYRLNIRNRQRETNRAGRHTLWGQRPRQGQGDRPADAKLTGRRSRAQIKKTAAAERLHIERFGLSAEDLPSKATSGFTVHLARQNIDVRIAPGETVLGALIQAGIDVPYSCEEGVCGACETKLLSGAALHQDSVRSPEEHDRRGTFMPCCSLSRDGDLVLDI